MDFGKYQLATADTALYHKTIRDSVEDTIENKEVMKVVDILEFSYVTLGLVGEAGEIANKVKKIIRDKGSVVSSADIDDLSKELGDVLWYASELATQLGKSLNSIAQGNLDKLSARKQAGTLQGSGDTR